MARLTLVPSKTTTTPEPFNELLHRTSASEGQAVIALLERYGYPMKRQANKQSEHGCPFHEEPGPVPRGKATNFYVDIETGLFYCHAASCAARGNLRIIERHFGIDIEDELPHIQSREERLQAYEANLIPQRRFVFHRQGLDDHTIARFRLGYDPEKEAWVIPYLEGRRPVQFRFYNPERTDDGPRYWWDAGANAQLFNTDDLAGNREGKVIIAEGEIKTMLLCQLGYAAVGVPGATNFKDEWFKAFNDIREVTVLFDNDNPAHHVKRDCPRCNAKGLEHCHGHNPGQEAATRLVEAFGWRGRNVVLPLPDEDVRKTDVNEYFVRDGHTAADFAEVAFGVSRNPYRVATLADIMEDPPEESPFLVEGVLPTSGRLLIAGKSKSGKSLLVENLALSIAAGIPFLNRFKIDHPARVLLLDREISRRALYDRLLTFMDARPGYRAAVDNLHIDHEHFIKLDRMGAYETLLQLVEQNGAEVVILDAAYKFFADSVERGEAIDKAHDVLDRLIHATGCCVVLAHHLKKKQPGLAQEVGDVDQIAGSWRWSGWPNATIQLDFLNRTVKDPFNVVCSFVGYRDAAPPPPLILYRNRESIVYSGVGDYDTTTVTFETPDDAPSRPSTDLIADMLLRACPVLERDFLQAAAEHFRVRVQTVRPFYVDAVTSGDFVRSGDPTVVRFRFEPEVETWEEEHLPGMETGDDGPPRHLSPVR